MKHRQALAYFGGAPAFAQPLHVAQLNLPEWERIESRFRDIFRRHFFANNGPLVQALDVAFADYAGVEHAVSGFVYTEKKSFQHLRSGSIRCGESATACQSRQR